MMLWLLLLFLFFRGEREMSGEGMKDAANDPCWNQTKFAARKTAEKPEDEDQKRHEEQRQQDGQQTNQRIRHRDGVGEGLVMTRMTVVEADASVGYLNFELRFAMPRHPFNL